jgi:hypothetical protein
MVDDGFISLQLTIHPDSCSFKWCNTDIAILIGDMSMLLENTKTQ